jgi:hypothetical protein
MTSRRRRRSNSERRWIGNPRPSPVRRTARSRSHERSEGLFRMPWVNSSASIRFSIRTLSCTRLSRSRCVRLGIFLIWRRNAHHAAALAIPRRKAASTRSMPTASSRSVLARRARRLTRMLVGSSTWVSTPCAVRKRCSQNPSRPASKQQTTLIVAPCLRATPACSDEMRVSKATVSPPSIRCRCGFSDPGTRAATTRGCTEFDSKENGRTIDVVRLHDGSSIALIRTAEAYRLSPPP